jgi:hypothetical protein
LLVAGWEMTSTTFCHGYQPEWNERRRCSTVSSILSTGVYCRTAAITGKKKKQERVKVMWGIVERVIMWTPRTHAKAFAQMGFFRQHKLPPFGKSQHTVEQPLYNYAYISLLIMLPLYFNFHDHV